jgi:PTH1 family peptidyl-tRNA hydrolase
MKLVVGLGNPGPKYAKTRHNVGFLVLAELARRHANAKPRGQFSGETVEARVDGEKVLLLSPLTYMNDSGRSVQPARDFYKLENDEILVICDDFQLALARLRFRPKGSDGGQKGLADIIRRLGSGDVPRLRIGIGNPPEGWDPAAYVLGKFTKEEIPEVEEAVSRAADAVADWTRLGIQHCMNHYNAS